MPIQETKKYQELFQKWNKLANKITYHEPTHENFRELANLSNELAEMIDGNNEPQSFRTCAKYRNAQCDPRHGDDCLECMVFERSW